MSGVDDAFCCTELCSFYFIQRNASNVYPVLTWVWCYSSACMICGGPFDGMLACSCMSALLSSAVLGTCKHCLLDTSVWTKQCCIVIVAARDTRAETVPGVLQCSSDKCANIQKMLPLLCSAVPEADVGRIPSLWCKMFPVLGLT